MTQNALLCKGGGNDLVEGGNVYDAFPAKDAFSKQGLIKIKKRDPVIIIAAATEKSQTKRGCTSTFGAKNNAGLHDAVSLGNHTVFNNGGIVRMEHGEDHSFNVVVSEKGIKIKSDEIF